MERAVEHRTALPEAAPDPAQRAVAGPAAQVLGLQRAIGNRRTAALVGGRPARRISRYKILGPWNSGQAVHETLTLLAVKKAKERLEGAGQSTGDLLSGFDTKAVPDTGKTFSYDPEDADKSHAQFIRGVVWADDPGGLLFDNEEDTSNYSSALLWGTEYKAGQGGDFSTLTARSHFGDLQFFHGMATKDDELPATTKQHMLEWARFLIDVAAGRVSVDAKLKDTAVSAVFKGMEEKTVKQLFGFSKASAVQARQRAVGALFHMVQDSFAHGHVERDAAGDIVEFHAYGKQDEHEHGKHDYLGGTDKEKLGDRLAKTGGASTAIDRCADVLAMIAEGKPTDEIVKFLDETVFKLSGNAKKAGPGTGLTAQPKPKIDPKYTRPHPGKI
jgi:hypothetical protein